MKKICLFGLWIVLAVPHLFAQERATTESGRIVILHPDMTWEFASVDTDSLQIYFGNLHSHTSYSDGVATPDVAYQHARDVAGLDFLAITEHNHASAGDIATNEELYSGSSSISLISTANRLTRDGEFVAIYGQEFSSISSGNHANVLEVGEVIRTSEVPNGAWNNLLNEWLPDHLDSQNNPAILLLNHPATRSSPDSREYGIDDFADIETWRTRLDAHAQLINIINGPSHDQASPSRASEGEFLRYLNLGLHVAPTADQDNHRANWGSAADTRTAVIAKSLTKADILTALRARHVYATEDRNLQVIVTVNGELAGTHFRGDQVPAQGDALDIQIRLTDPDEPLAIYTIDVFADEIGGANVADVVAQVTAEGDGVVSLNGITYAGGLQYFFVKITQTDDDHVEEDRVWVAPVWFEPDAVVPPPPTPELTLEVNEQLETATITNVGNAAVNLRNWTLVSVRGDQRFTFTDNVVLNPQEQVVVTSGPNAQNNPPAFIRWTTFHQWSNSGDPGQLLDPDGNLRAETQ